ncbi:dTMP kinase [Patulibacter minatonensis]|uniref:dTMP kinase n=1 Tax=Patulibacter minatonensis TaxID=298163 RepID=UPI00047D7F6B|nr:dTMP kinase [Patulibacter minatonensis]
MPEPRGRLITIEGLDGSGKTTLADGLEAALLERGLPVLRLREPGGVELSERIRALVADPALDVHPHTEALLFAAARAQLCAELLVPALREGRWVLLDRFVDSSLAYQGGGRGLGLEAVARVNELATLGCRPDRTLLLRVSRSAGRRRLDARGGGQDRMEREDDAFFARVESSYDALATGEPERFRTLDAHKDASAVLADALDAMADILQEPVTK